MTNETLEKIETVDTETIANVDSGKGLVIAVGIGLTALAGGIAYKFIVKPLKAKIKAKKEETSIVEINADEIDDAIDEGDINEE